jgi:hypothetical protein
VAGLDRMTTEAVVRKVLLDEHAGVLRESLKLLMRELMQVDVSELSAPSSASDAPTTAPPTATTTGPGVGTRAPARSNCRSRSCARGVTSRAFCDPASAPGRRWRRSSRRPKSAAFRPVGSTSWSSRCAADFALGGLAHLRLARRAGRGLPPAPLGGPLSLSLPRRQGREGQGRRSRRAEVRGRRARRS